MGKTNETTTKEPADTTVDNAWQDNLTGVSVDAEAPLISFPTMMYISGRPDAKGHWRYFGNFFIPEDAGVTVDDTWTPVEYITRENSTVIGWVRDTVNVSVIRARRAWFVEREDGKAKRFPWQDYDIAKKCGDPRGKCQIVMDVEGVSAPVALTLRGTLSGHALERGGWGQLARQYLYDAVARARTRPGETVARLPSLCFRITIGEGGRVWNGGEPDWMTVGKGRNTSIVTPIRLLDPMSPVKPEDFSRYIVNRFTREEYETIWHECTPWVEAWDKRQEHDEEYLGRETSID